MTERGLLGSRLGVVGADVRGAGLLGDRGDRCAWKTAR